MNKVVLGMLLSGINVALWFILAISEEKSCLIIVPAFLCSLAQLCWVFIETANTIIKLDK